MIEQLIIDLPDGLTVDAIYTAAAIKAGYTDTITQLGAEAQHIAPDRDAAALFISGLQVSGGKLIPPTVPQPDGSFLITYQPRETVANPLTQLEFGQQAIEELFRAEAIDAVVEATPIQPPAIPMTPSELAKYMADQRQAVQASAEAQIKGKGRVHKP